MLFGRKKETAIDRRIREIQKEMERVGGELKSVTQPKPEPAAPKASSPASSVGSRTMAGFEHGRLPPKGNLPEGDLFAHASRMAGGMADEADLFGRSDDDARQTVRERFANYFMAGHFPNLRPPRQQRRIMRNKAIIMIVVVLAIVFWLVYFLQTH